MQEYISRNYQYLLAFLLVIGLVSAFYTGFLEGQHSGTDQVTLSCSENILSKLSIPLDELAAGTANASSGVVKSVSTEATTVKGGNYVASKNGTKYYTSLSCSGAKRIKAENRIWFDSAEDAQIQGYSLGKC